MEFLQYRAIKAKLKKKGLLFKKPSLEDALSQFYALARQLDDHKLYSGFCHLAITNCSNNKSSNQVGAFLNAARAFSQAQHEVVSKGDLVRAVIWIYTEALLTCDRSFIKPIRLEMGRFYESHRLHQQAAECFKQSMSISRCVYNLILANQYQNALVELKNCPSHLMTTKDYTSMVLLELLLNDDFEDLKRNSLQHLASSSRTSTSRGLLPIDDHLFDLTALIESLMMLQKDKNETEKYAKGNCVKDSKIKNLIVDKLSAFLDPAQIQLLNQITSSA